MSLMWAWVEVFDANEIVELGAEEARHVAVRRLRPGEPLMLFDGAGRTARARIEEISKRRVSVVREDIELHARNEAGLVLASAIPKGDRLSTLLQMTSQLGLGCWQPMCLEDSAVRDLEPGAPRLRRILIESCKVARRPWALEIAEPCSLEDALGRYGGKGRVRFGDREGTPAQRDPEVAMVLIGPEAGFSSGERERLLASGAEPVALAPYNLRIETAAIAAVAALGVVSTVPGSEEEGENG